MNKLDAVLHRISRIDRLEHLGHDKEVFFESIDSLLSVKKQAVSAEIHELSRLQNLAYFVSVLLLFGVFSLWIFTLFQQQLIISGMSGLLSLSMNVSIVVLFRRIGRCRETIQHLLPEYRDLFAAVVALENSGPKAPQLVLPKERDH